VRRLRYGAPGQERSCRGAALLPAAIEQLPPWILSVFPRWPARHGSGPVWEPSARSGMAIPKEPPLFLKPSSAIVGPNDDVEIPLGSEKTDWEVEVGVVVGNPGKYLRIEQALDHVAGYWHRE